MKTIGPFSYRGPRFSHFIPQFFVTFAQFLRHLHISVLLIKHGELTAYVACH
jgi:hypothetical protein